MKLSKIKPNPDNPRILKDDKFRKLVKSIQDFPEMMEKRPIVVDENNVVLGGNMRLRALQEIYGKNGEVPDNWVTTAKGWSKEKKKEFVIKDNSSFGEWDWDMLANEWDTADLSDWGVDFPQDWAGGTPTELPDDEEIRRKEQEFQQRMAAGEDLSEDEDYLEFLDKFKAKKTTDDCYTPAVVYEAVAKWVENEYKVSRKDFVRPFYPGGDYKAEKYPKGCIVVDNPPFSILAEILNFYKDNGVRFFLFAPTLTLFSSSSSSSSSALPCGAAVVYENGASVNTSFLTNLEDRAIRFKSCPSLYQAVQAASDEYDKELHKELPKYSYPDYVVTAAFVARLSKYGIPFEVSVGQSCAISSLDSQRDTKKAIYGKGYLVSEKAAAEKAAATRWTLSDRERAIIAKLSKNDSNGND